MDSKLQFENMLMKHFVFLLMSVALVHHSSGFGFDSATSCSPNGKTARRGRAQIIAAIPCDLSTQAYCQLPGAAYPWHAVRRFVHENQGLMKRMYGDVRHISILRNEIQTNEIDIEDLEQAAERYSRDGFRRSSKYLQNSDGNTRNNEVLKEPHFRPVVSTTSTPASSTTMVTTTTTKATTNLTSDSGKTTTFGKNVTTTTSSNVPTTQLATKNNNNTAATESKKQAKPQSNLDDVELSADSEEEEDESAENNEDGSKRGEDGNNLESNSVYEPLTSPKAATNGENIQIVQSPQLSQFNISASPASEAATISTILKVATTTTTTTANKAENVLPPSTSLEKQPPLQQQQQITPPSTTTTVVVLANQSSKRAPLLPVKANTTPTIKINNSKIYNNNAAAAAATTEATLSKATVESGEAVRKPAITASLPTLTTPSATKPFLRDGQLFQDTVHRESVPIVNMRGVNACPVKEEVVAPFWANNTRGEILALLNLYPFEQYVHWEKCTHEHKQMYCREGCRCEQQYRLHRLLAYDPHNECRGIFSDWFRFPSCCICKCYDIPPDFRATSRSPRSDGGVSAAAAAAADSSIRHRHPIEVAEAEVKKAIYDHATEDWYRPRDDPDSMGIFV